MPNSGPPDLAHAYERCAAEVERFVRPMWHATEALPAPARRHVLAVQGFQVRTDRIADEGGTRAEREAALASWCSETLEELRTGRSEHPLRRAFVDTARRWDLDRALVEEFFDATRADCAGPPAFETFADQRRYLRGITVADLWAPLLECGDPAARARLAVLGEACQLVDIFEDLPADLAAGRCYLPRADLRRLGLRPEELRSDKRRELLDELVSVQLGRWARLLEEAAPVAGLVDQEYRPFLHALVLGAQVQFDEVTLRRGRVFADGIEPVAMAGDITRRPARHDGGAVPGHIAVIMDGNRRWAAQHGLPVSQGYYAGLRTVLRLVNAALRLGVRHLSVYAFSTENWNRSQDEVLDLFGTVADMFARGAEWLHGLGVRVTWCGRRERLEPSLASSLALLESLTSNNDVLRLTVCVDYGGRDELAAAARALAAEAVAGTLRPADIGPEDLARSMYVPDLPDVDLLIRTSGEQRISNFLPWHLAYAELHFDPTPWPDYGLAQLREAVAAYAARDRRFGGGVPGPARPAEPARQG